MPIQSILASLVVTLHLLSATMAQTADAASIPRIASTTPLATQADISAYIQQEASDYGVDPNMALKVANAESGLQPDIQSQYKDPTGPNGREDSWGIFQIHLPAHKEVTHAEAIDPAFNIEWSMKEMSKDGSCKIWTTCYEK